MYRIVDLIDEATATGLVNVTKGCYKSIGDKTTHGTEYDLTDCAETVKLKTNVEEICSLIYKKTLKCNNYWISISEPSTNVVSHDHSDGSTVNLYSAVLYLQADNNSGVLTLEDYSIDIHPKVGQLITFPSSCKHSVSTNKSSRDRICIAFDLS